MKKHGLLLFVLLLVMSIFVACSGEKGLATGKALTIEKRELTADEEMLVWNAGGSSMVQHFRIRGTIPDGYMLELTVEEYEKGEFIHDRASIPVEGGLEEDSGIGFGGGGDGEENTLIFASAGGKSEMIIENFEGASASTWGEMIGDGVTINPDEPVYLAYWVGTFDDEINVNNSAENNYAGLKNHDKSFLLKAELKEK